MRSKEEDEDILKKGIESTEKFFDRWLDSGLSTIPTTSESLLTKNVIVDEDEMVIHIHLRFKYNIGLTSGIMTDALVMMSEGDPDAAIKYIEKITKEFDRGEQNGKASH